MSTDYKIIRYALNVAKLMEEIEYERASLEYDKLRMSEVGSRIERLKQAIDEFQYE